MKNSVGARLII